MKTITFYSYKGGVGRTLALVNIANRLAEFGKKVCIMDFDLEAPGLDHKYRCELKSEIKQGLVDYIYEFAINDILPESLKDYSVEVSLPNVRNKITLIPAGESQKCEYWRKLSRINWWDLFYQDNSQGVPFFLDLKEKIKKEFNPDYLLIDTRTGITEMSSVTMSILADSIAIFAVNNYENICGSKNVIQNITKKENDLLENNPEIHFTLTRIPVPSTPDGKSREEEIVNKISRDISESLKINGKSLQSFNIIHSDREIELDEKVRIGYDFQANDSISDIDPKISLEYLNLFNHLTKEDLTTAERERFNSMKQVEQLLEQARKSLLNNESSFIESLKKIETIDPDNFTVYIFRGMYYYKNEKYQLALEQFNKAIELGDPFGDGLFFRSLCYYNLQQYNKAFKYIDEYLKKQYRSRYQSALTTRLDLQIRLGYDTQQLIEEAGRLIEKYPANANFYNIRSCLYRSLGQYEQALIDIYKAIELDSNVGTYYATLAEIKACQNDQLEFYRNFDIAMRLKFDTSTLFQDIEDTLNIYMPYFRDEKFIKLLEKYDQFKTIELIHDWLNKHQ